MAHLKRTLGLFEVTLCGIGIILGAGIYVLIGQAAGLAGNALWMSFLFGAAVAAFSGLSYAELSSMYPKAGAEYDYTKRAFGRQLAFVTGWLILFGGIVGAATVSTGFAGYFSAIFGTPVLITAIVLIALLSFLLFWGVKQSAWVAILFTLVETAGLLAIIAIGAPYFGSVDYLKMPDLAGVFSAAALIFFAFIGFEQIARLSEETRNPEKNIPRALILSIILTTIIYMLVAVSAVSVISSEKLAASKAPLADIASHGFGQNAFLILAVIALFSTSNTVLLMLLATSRITYGMSRGNSLPACLGKIHGTRRTPWLATALAGIGAAAFVLVGDLKTIANITNFTVYITFIIINLSLILLRYSEPNTKRPFRVPLSIGKLPILPAFGALSCAAMLFGLTIDIVLYGLALLLIGYLFYFIFEKICVPKKGLRAV